MAILKKRTKCANCNRVMPKGTEIGFKKICTPKINGAGFRVGEFESFIPKHKTTEDCSKAITEGHPE